MIWIKRYIWLFSSMMPWVFKHSFHGTNHQVNGHPIERNYDKHYFRCYRCQAQLSIPA